MKHTPGPWEVVNDDTPWTEGDSELAVAYNESFGDTSVMFSVIGGIDDNVICRTIWEPMADIKKQDELQANAHLIATAPVMLEALELAYKELEFISMNCTCIENDVGPIYILMEVIRKAKGE